MAHTLAAAAVSLNQPVTGVITRSMARALAAAAASSKQPETTGIIIQSKMRTLSAKTKTPALALKQKLARRSLDKARKVVLKKHAKENGNIKKDENSNIVKSIKSGSLERAEQKPRRKIALLSKNNYATSSNSQYMNPQADEKRKERKRTAALQRAKKKEEKSKQNELLRLQRLQEQEEREKLLAEQKRRQEQVEKLKQTEIKMKNRVEKVSLQQSEAKALALKQVPCHYKIDSDPDDGSDDENKPKHQIPNWASKNVRQAQLTMQQHIPMWIVLEFFDAEECTPDLRELFLGIDPKKLKRSSSAIWKIPPRYSMMN